jgi:hypothetical protein
MRQREEVQEVLPAMSEHQCYEFLALERPLTRKQMDELRAVSSRAEITPARFWNEYHWGDLKADPAKLVERYFDAHMYFANWGTHRLILRVPIERVAPKSLRAYFVGDAARARVTGEHLILDLRSEDEERNFDEDGQDSLAALALVRTDLMRGDLRVAYLAWLLAVQAGELGDDQPEPPVPPGLSDLTASQAAMAEFLRIDEDLISAAADASHEASDDRPALRKWVVALPPRVKDDWLRRAVDEPDLALGGELLRVYRAESKPPLSKSRRTVADLLAGAERHRLVRERAEADRADKAKRAAEVARKKRLDRLAARVDAAWAELEALVEKSAYEEALLLATDLRDLSARDGAAASFADLFKAMRKRQLRRRGFFDRWTRANAPER